MTDSVQPLGTIQVAYIVTDLDAAMATWLDHGLAGPFFTLEGIQFVEPIHRGAPVDLDLDVAMTAVRGVNVELIHQRCDTPSVYKELVDRTGRGGFHHWGVLVDNLDAAVREYQQRGQAPAFMARLQAGGGFAYMDTVEELGAMVELIEMQDQGRQMFQMIEDAAATWDGSDPIRSLRKRP